MVVKYLDPYKDDPYAKLKGDKAETFFKVEFSEAQIHKADDCYILAGVFDSYFGIVRAFKPENPITKGLCALPIYGKVYEIRKKDKNGNWISEDIEPSTFEKALYDAIAANEDFYLPHNASIKGSFSHIPNPMLQGKDANTLVEEVLKNVPIEEIDASGNLPEYKVPTGGGQRRSQGGYRGVTMEEKIAFLKKQMEEDVKSDMFKGGQCLADMTDQIIKEHADNPNFIEIYFDLLIACVK
jgi:hypothetical protein